MREEFIINSADDVKANYFLLGIIAVFLLMTLIAFLFTDGRRTFLTPVLRNCCPDHEWAMEKESIVNNLQREQSCTNTVQQQQ